MLAGLRRIAGWLTRRWGFPANLQWWWVLLGLPSVPALISGIIAFVRDAPLWQMVLIIIGVYCVALIIAALALERRLPAGPFAGRTTGQRTPRPATTTPGQTPQRRTARAVITQDVAVGEVSRLDTSIPLDKRQRLIEKWRAEIRTSSFNRTPHGASEFVLTDTYTEMSPWLPDKIRHRFEGDVIRQAAIILGTPPHERGAEGDRRVLLREVSRIAKEWSVI